MSEQFDVVIVGGGIIGASIAYHLGALGQHSVCLLEQHELTSGTTWHAAGLVAELRASANLTRLARYSALLYEQLDAEGYATGFRRPGALTLSRNAARTHELARQASMARANGIDCEWLVPAALAERWPELAVDDLDGGLWLPRDGQTSPVDTTRALIQRARASGVEVRESTAVLDFEQRGTTVVAVQTPSSTLRCRTLVLAAGLWTRALAQKLGADVPVYPCEHFYAVTEPVPRSLPMPIVRVPDDGVYLKPETGPVLLGCFEREGKPVPPARLPAQPGYIELPFDLEHFAPYLEAGLARVPALTEVGIRTWFNGPESFTPDGRYLLGRLPRHSNLYVAAGFNSIGIQSAGGVGQVMARWVTDALPPMDLWEVDVRRVQPLQNRTGYLEARCAESLGQLYAMHWPYRQMETARNERRSPFHDLLAQRGAVFGELAGWERANWYAQPGQDAAYAYSWQRQNWFENAAREHHATREGVALFDPSSFAKFLLRGPGALAFLNHCCTAQLDVPPGRVVYTQCLNERGGIEADVTVTRLQRDEFLYVTAAPCGVRDSDYLHQHRGPLELDITDVTERYAVLGLMGPQSRELLASLCPESLDNADFPFGTARDLTIAGVRTLALRTTYVGALGWELYLPWAQAASVLPALLDAGATPAGYHAMDSLRIEKAYRHWGHDLTDEDTPLEAGLGFTVAWDKPEGFIGREALAEQRAQGLPKRLLLFALSDREALLYHDEPIWSGGVRVGHIRSGAYGHSLGQPLGFGYVETTEHTTLKALCGRSYDVEVAGERIAAQAHARAVYDPKHLELKR
ncbi:MAG: FAD-dependent oxidoreductase [Pseudomonadota bacterium]